MDRVSRSVLYLSQTASWRSRCNLQVHLGSFPSELDFLAMADVLASSLGSNVHRVGIGPIGVPGDLWIQYGPEWIGLYHANDRQFHRIRDRGVLQSALSSTWGKERTGGSSFYSVWVYKHQSSRSVVLSWQLSRAKSFRRSALPYRMLDLRILVIPASPLDCTCDRAHIPLWVLTPLLPINFDSHDDLLS